MPYFPPELNFYLFSAPATFALFWSNLHVTVAWRLLLADRLILDPIVFSTNQTSLLQIFALLFEINCTEINQSQSSNIFIYIIIKLITSKSVWM
jgi:hypothetical protein